MAIEVVLPRLNSYDIPLLNAVFSPDDTTISPTELQPYRVSAWTSQLVISYKGRKH